MDLGKYSTTNTEVINIQYNTKHCLVYFFLAFPSFVCRHVTDNVFQTFSDLGVGIWRKTADTTGRQASTVWLSLTDMTHINKRPSKETNRHSSSQESFCMILHKTTSPIQSGCIFHLFYLWGVPQCLSIKQSLQ